MPRPRPDAERIKDRLLDEAERMLKQTKGRRLVMSEIADRVGMSQSNAHRYFATRDDLVRGLALRWFEEVHRQSAAVVALDIAPGEKLERWLLTILAIKRDRYDADPELFDAYLELSAGHMDIVRDHAAELTRHLERILRDLVPPETLLAALNLVEDATVLFRAPQNISLFRSRATDARAIAVVTALRQVIEQKPQRL